MSESLSAIEARTIEAAWISDEEVSLTLSGEWSVSIYSMASMTINGSTEAISEANLIGETVVRIVLCEECLAFVLSSSSLLRVDLRPEAFRAPEAMVVRGPAGEFIVLN